VLLDERPLGFDLPGWIYEIKLDGYRITAKFGNGKCFLRSRNGAAATSWFPEITRALGAVPGAAIGAQAPA
jgi:bifunctional non-homologous end joining protein LigD